MNGIRRLGLVAVAASVVAACGGASDQTKQQAADTATTAAAPVPSFNGTWDMRSVPESGDTAPTVFQAKVENDVWTLLLPNRPPIPATSMVQGDSVIVDAGPYESVRRAGVQVTVHSVYRLSGDQLNGYSIAHYKNAGADSVLRLTSTGTRVQ
jgi:glucose/arabinose dehydrogenase